MSDVLAKYIGAISAHHQEVDDMRRNLLESLFTFLGGILEDKYSGNFMVFFEKDKKSNAGLIARSRLTDDQILYLQYIIDGLKRRL